MNHKRHHLTTNESAKILLQGFLITIVVAVLFYQSLWGMVLLPIFIFFSYKQIEKKSQERKKQLLEEQFMHGIQVLNQALAAGMSMENAWREVQKETKLLYGEEAEFYLEIKEMNHSVEMNMPIEKLFLEVSYRCGLEDMISFAEIFEYGKRCGGNWRKIIHQVVQRMNEKYDTKKEIAIMIAEKQMEQKIMNLVPLGMLCFLKLSAKDYMEVLYHNPLGIFCMSLCLVGYVTAFWLSERILHIEV